VFPIAQERFERDLADGLAKLAGTTPNNAIPKVSRLR
jgi:hypothetical protein